MINDNQTSRSGPEEYELPRMATAGPSTSTNTHDHSHSYSGEDRRKSMNPRRRSSNGKKTITLHGNPSILFDAEIDQDTSAVHERDAPYATASSPKSPYRRRHAKQSSGPATPRILGGGHPTLHLPSTPAHQDLFLSDDHHGTGRAETVEVPDFSGMLGLNAEGEDNYLVAQNMTRAWKRRLFLLMEEPGSSREAFAIHVMSTGGILFSAILTILSTLPSFHTNPGSTKVLFGLDVMIVVLFTVEYAARFIAHSDSPKMLWNWFTSFFAIVDLLAILPFYIEIALQEDTTILFRFSILRTLRLLRVFRAFKYQNQMLFTIEVMYIAVHRSKDALFALSFFLVMAIVIFSTLIYFVERGVWDNNLGTFVTADGDPSEFESIPSAAWFVLVTITTVGYGEIIPRSVLGRLFTVPLLVFGLLLIALPSFVLGRNFAIVFDAMQHQLNVPVTKPSMANSARTSIDNESGYPKGHFGIGTADQSVVSLRPGSPASPQTSTFRLAERGIMSGGNQYDAVPLNDAPVRSAPTDVSMSGGDTFRSASAQGQKTGGAQSAMVGNGTAPQATARDLSNAKLALNQSVLLSRIDRLTEVTERQGEMLNRILSLLESTDDGKGIKGHVI